MYIRSQQRIRRIGGLVHQGLEIHEISIKPSANQNQDIEVNSGGNAES